MDLVTLTVALILLLFLVLATGVWIAVALGFIGFVAMLVMAPAPSGPTLASAVWSSSIGWDLTALPMFILMGEILFRTKLSEDMFQGLAPWLQRLPGRLIHTNVVGCTIFAAVSGSSAATCATIGRMSVPELQKRGYPQPLAIGSLAGAGTLGLLIPPSLIMIVYAAATDESIARLFIAGVIPGIVLAGLFMAYVVMWSLLKPAAFPPKEPPFRAEPRAAMVAFVATVAVFAGVSAIIVWANLLPWYVDVVLVAAFAAFAWGARHKLVASRRLIPVVLLIAGVIGSIYGGLASATEAAVVGAFLSLALAWFQGTLNRRSFADAMLGAARTSCMICFILAGAAFLSVAMGFTGIPRALATWVGAFQLQPWMLIAALTVFFIILGCFLDGISMIVLTTSVIMPLIDGAGIDRIWFGIFLVVVVEMAQITPPVGFNLYVLQSMTGKNIFTLGLWALPFFLLMMVMVALLWLFPEMALWLPRTMLDAGR
jgi:TRAP-type C4-dicarboxylate transport system permease large subunit